MRELFLRLVDEVPYKLDRGTSFGFLQSVIRSVLQHCAYSALDYCYSVTGTGTGTLLPEVAAQLLQPSDGDLPPAIDRLLDIVRDEGWTSCAPAWTKWTSPLETPGLSNNKTLANAAKSFVEFRNNRAGHGVVDQSTVEEGMGWLPGFARALIDGMADLLPVRVDDSNPRLELAGPDRPITLQSIKIVGSYPIVVRRAVRLGSGWRVEYQTLDPRSSVSGFYELDDEAPLVKLLTERPELYRQVNVGAGDTAWKPTVRLPQRQTTVFEGRAAQLEGLQDWLEDMDSRACLVYGEGGIGKTTLVLEFLHRLLDEPKQGWRPDVICFYSAKETRWGPNGLERITGRVPSLGDAGRLLARLFLDRLERTWYTSETRGLLGRVEKMFLDSGLKRDRVLLVLDNTETLARAREEEPQLVRELAYITSRLARVIITSRRREEFEARPLKVEGMTQAEGEQLLRRLALEYRAEPLRMAGAAKLRNVAERLRGSPLLLDVLARLVAREGVSIDRGVQRVLEKAADDLGTFLFDDAWARIESAARRVFLVVAQLDSTIDGEVVGWACSEAHISHTDFLDAFEETRFGSIHEYGTRYDLVLNPGMREFLSREYARLESGAKKEVDAAAAKLQARRRALIDAGVSEVSDRVARAFTSAAARAAKLATIQGNLEEAIQWYEMAVQTEPENAALWDRFAWFLMRYRRDFDRAWACAQQACARDPDDPESHFTAGLIGARRGDITNADRLLQRAHELGKPLHLCALQQAWGRFRALSALDVSSSEVRTGAAQRLFDEADELLAKASLTKVSGANDAKHMDERNTLIARLAYKRQKLLRTRTSTDRYPGRT